jgi:asparagine synthetase B (glutamine-hydrolysing)
MSDVPATTFTPLEVASGLILGTLPEETDLPRRPRVSARAALERAVLDAVARPPCFVSFSGGRDSSAVLALASHVARTEGLPLPIPATNVFPAVELTDETGWQERVVQHLGLDEWIRLEHDDELDIVGEVAADVLSRHGLLWPFNAHFHAPLIRLASGGTLLTGIGGDELLQISDASRWNDIVSGRARPEPRDMLRLGFTVAPRTVRRHVKARRLPLDFGWLRPDARRTLALEWADNSVRQPHGWEQLVRWVLRMRYVHVGTASLDRLAADENVSVRHPFLSPDFGEAVASLPKDERFRDRTRAMTRLFGDLLPADVLERRTKASFDGAFWAEPSRMFARDWDGGGVDERVVDLDALHKEWTKEAPDPRTFLLAQSAWLLTHDRSADRLEKTLNGVVE